MCITDFLVNEFKFRVVKGAKTNVIQRGRWVWRCWEPMLWVNWSVVFSFPWLLFLQAPLSLEMQTLQYRVGSAWDPPSVGETHTVFVCQPLPCLSTRCQQCPRRLAGCAVPPWEFTKQHKVAPSALQPSWSRRAAEGILITWFPTCSDFRTTTSQV